MELEGMPPMEWTYSCKSDWQTALIWGYTFGHQIIDNNDGSVIIKHSVA